MLATVFDISERNHSFPAEVRHSGQFTLTNGRQVGADIVLGANWSLYCLDIAANSALFVELPDRSDLASAPFIYGMQFETAFRAASVPLEMLPDLAKAVPAPKNLALLMSTGRCGSTLASRIVAQIPDVWSLSEPDWFTNIAFARSELTHERLETLISACTRLSCRPPEGKTPTAIVLKPRSEMMIQASAYVDTLSGANAVFLYRDCFGFANSLYRFAQRMLGEKDPAPGSAGWQIVREISTINGPMSDLQNYFADGEDIQILDLMTLGWALRMRAYLKASSGGMRVTPIHYADLSSDRRAQTALLLESCGIDTGHLDVALQGFEKDAHAGSAGENAVPADPITQAQRERVAELVSRWGLSDYVTDRLPPLVHA